MWATSMVCVQVKSAEINSLSSCEICLIGLWQVQEADSVDTKGKLVKVVEYAEGLVDTFVKFTILNGH